MLRRKNRIRRATGDQGSAIQQHCVRTISPRKAEIVYHGEDSASLSGTEPGFEKRKDLLLIDEIQMIGRLVENQNLWVLGEKLRKKDPLQLAAGKRQNGASGQREHARQLQRLPDAALVSGLLLRENARRMGIPAKPDHLAHGEGIADMVALRKNADMPRQHMRPVPFDVLPAVANAAPVGNALSDGLHKSGFSRAVGTDEHQPATLRKGEADVIQNLPAAVLHGQICNGKQRHRSALLDR